MADRARALALTAALALAAGAGLPPAALAGSNPPANPDAASPVPSPATPSHATDLAPSQAQSRKSSQAPKEPTPAELGRALDALGQELEAFARGPDARLAPQTTAQARAVLGAAIVARRRHDAAALAESLRTARSLLASARKLAASFRAKYKDVLKLEGAAREAAGDIPAPDLAAAESKLDALAAAVERGDLNQAARLHDEAAQAFTSVLRTKLPPLLDKTDAALLKARRAGAKRYAPTLYEAARKWLAGALAWVNGASRVAPEHPRRGLMLAEAAKGMAEQVKQLRKHPDSYEKLLLEARARRVRLALALGLEADPSDPLADADEQALLAAIRKLKNELARERKARMREKDALKAEYERKLAEQAEAVRQQMQAQAAAQIAQLKEAFRAKLERETFESRRLKTLRKLFKKGEVQVLSNLDGSVLIRLSALKFAPGKSTLDRRYFDLLRRVKKALELYPDRKIVIEGHTDNKGDARANQVLSLKRAEGVRDFLVAAGMRAARLKALGFGEVRPIASNDYERGRAMNRRIDIIIQPAGGK